MVPAALLLPTPPHPTQALLFPYMTCHQQCPNSQVSPMPWCSQPVGVLGKGANRLKKGTLSQRQISRKTFLTFWCFSFWLLKPLNDQAFPILPAANLTELLNLLAAPAK